MPWPEIAALAVSLAILAALVIASALRPKARERRHRRRQDQARRVLAKINTIPLMPQRLAYLRKIDPLTFEELLLEAFERRGYRVERNTHYTGDGGVDGAVYLNGTRYLLQAKRYRKHVNRAHIIAFAQLLETRGCRGIFIHTGRTGAGTRELAAANPNLTIISGQRLLDLLNSGGAAKALAGMASWSKSQTARPPRRPA
ncbi:restriction endonuclease (plasmid) [Xanthomonas translucens pv. translucens]|uniref:restriction endonuclease n=2 Tax=Xanthomonas campestris pv. translucens TaxID=343 RepID=UPI0021BA890D|nr:restriction endonuclease [Xanthomonas translucens]MCT8308744.1 restriction endonuclease [Xanthomonas translucens pv. translucens]WNJ25388.1 restriction endonuclease [Xanthomonas translucens pv. translucens]